jgi:zinc transport system substrate-binding protein
MKRLLKFQNPKSPIGILLFYMACIFFSVFTSVSLAGSGVSDNLTIYVVNYPLKYFAERIAGNKTRVVFPAPADGDPAYWVPDAKTITAYQQADLVLLNGANYAKWVQKASLPRSKMVDTSAKVKDRYITADEIVTHSHGAEGKHAHESLAFTTWLDLDLAIQLSRKHPSMKDSFQKNFEALEKELLALDRKIKAIVTKSPSRPLLASHPVYDYLSSRYGLNLKSVHWEPDEVPNAEQWVELNGILKEHPAEWMIWEGEPVEASIEKLKAIGIKSLVFDPCGNIPDKGDFMSVMQDNMVHLQQAFK